MKKGSAAKKAPKPTEELLEKFEEERSNNDIKADESLDTESRAKCDDESLNQNEKSRPIEESCEKSGTLIDKGIPVNYEDDIKESLVTDKKLNKRSVRFALPEKEHSLQDTHEMIDIEDDPTATENTTGTNEESYENSRGSEQHWSSQNCTDEIIEIEDDSPDEEPAKKRNFFRSIFQLGSQDQTGKNTDINNNRATKDSGKKKYGSGLFNFLVIFFLFCHKNYTECH